MLFIFAITALMTHAHANCPVSEIHLASTEERIQLTDSVKTALLAKGYVLPDTFAVKESHSGSYYMNPALNEGYEIHIIQKRKVAEDAPEVSEAGYSAMGRVLQVYYNWQIAKRTFHTKTVSVLRADRSRVMNSRGEDRTQHSTRRKVSAKRLLSWGVENLPACERY